MNNSSDQDNQENIRGNTEIRWYIVLYIALGIFSTIILLKKIISPYCSKKKYGSKKKYYNPNYCYQDCYYDHDCYYDLDCYYDHDCYYDQDYYYDQPCYCDQYYC